MVRRHKMVLLVFKYEPQLGVGVPIDSDENSVVHCPRRRNDFVAQIFDVIHVYAEFVGDVY